MTKHNTPYNISVVLPVGPAETTDHLSECLTSLTDQSLQPQECVIVHSDKSIDTVGAAVKRVNPSFDIHRVAGPGTNLADALNEGIKASTGKLIARIDADDVATKRRLEKQHRVFERNPEVSVVGSYVAEYDEAMETKRHVRTVPTSHELIREFAIHRCPMNHPSVMYRKDDVDSIGGYEHHPRFEDYLLWIRMIQAGYRLYNIPEILTQMRTGTAFTQRRAGIKYAKNEALFFLKLQKMGFLPWYITAVNILTRAPIRLAPQSLVNIIYSQFRDDK